MSAQKRRQISAAMRREGCTWAQIADHFRNVHQVNARVAMRWAHGWTQAKVAAQWSARWPDDPKTARNISKWEIWPCGGHSPNLQNLACLAEIYRCDLAHLVADIGCHKHLDPNASNSDRSVTTLARRVVKPHASDNDGDVNRREFSRAAALSLVGLAVPLGELRTVSRGNVELIGGEHIQLMREAIRRVEADDATNGAKDLRNTVTAMIQQAEDWLGDNYRTDIATGNDLHVLTGELHAWAGWLAFDDEDPSVSARHAKEALVQARIADDSRLETHALNTLFLLALHDKPTEALNLADAMQHAIQGWATPRLLTLVALRKARAHAQMQDSGAFNTEMTRAMRHLDGGPHDDDPLWAHFVRPMEVCGTKAKSFLALGKPDRAAAEYQQLVGSPDLAYTRNLGLYRVELALAHADRGDVSAAAATAMTAMPQVHELGSARASRRLANLRASLDPHRKNHRARDFADAYDTGFLRG